MGILKEFNLFNNSINDYYLKFYEMLKELKIDDVNDYYLIEEHITLIDPKKYYERLNFGSISYDFVKYLSDKGLTKYKSIFNMNFRINDRRKHLIIYLQENPTSYEELSRYFMVDDRTIRRDLDEIEKGVKINDVFVKLNRVVNDGLVYLVNDDKFNSTIHPISLNLNMTELYTLLIDIAYREKENNISYNIYNSIMERIYSQLSDYGKDIIDVHEDKISYNETSNMFINEEQMHERDCFSRLITALKANKEVSIKYRFNDEILIKKVKVIMKKNGFLFTDKEKNKYLVEIKDILYVEKIFDF